MDTWSFHFKDSRIDFLGRNWKWFGWFAGKMSWQNKNNIQNKFLRAILRGPLVAFTDLWHSSQLFMFTCYQVLVAWHIPNFPAQVLDWFPNWLNIVVWVLAMKVIQGIGFEPLWRWLGSTRKNKEPSLSLEINALATDFSPYACEVCFVVISAQEYVEYDGQCLRCYDAIKENQ